MSYRDRYEQWIAKLPADDPMREELIAIRDNDEEIKERFYTEIEFGTAGLRGIRGAGTNRMNRLTVGRATQGIANYILASGEDGARRHQHDGQPQSQGIQRLQGLLDGRRADLGKDI